MTCFVQVERDGLTTTSVFEAPALHAEQEALFARLKLLGPPKEPLLADLYAEAKPGQCALCEGPLLKKRGAGRNRRICGSAECKRSWHTLHKAALGELRKAAAATERALVGPGQ